MLLSSSTPFLSFYFVLELLIECALVRLSLKELKIKHLSRAQNAVDVDAAPSSSQNSRYFKFILKSWTIFAFIALWARHIEPALRKLPASTLWYGFYATAKCLLIAVVLIHQLSIADIIFDRGILNIVPVFDREIPKILCFLEGVLKTAISWVALQCYQTLNIAREVLMNISLKEVVHAAQLFPYLLFAIIWPIHELDDVVGSLNRDVSCHSTDSLASNEVAEIPESKEPLEAPDELYEAKFSYDFLCASRLDETESSKYDLNSSDAISANFEYDGLDIVESPSRMKPVCEPPLSSKFNILSPEKFSGFIDEQFQSTPSEVSELVTKTSKRLSRFSLNFARSGIPGFTSIFGEKAHKSPPKLNLNLISVSPDLDPIPNVSHVSVRKKKSFTHRGAGLKKLF